MKLGIVPVRHSGEVVLALKNNLQRVLKEAAISRCTFRNDLALQLSSALMSSISAASISSPRQSDKGFINWK